MTQPQPRYNAISIFSGAMGLDLGIEAAGFNILMAADRDRGCIKTIRANRPDLPIYTDDIRKMTGPAVFDLIGHNQIDLLVGGPPCQSFSKIGNGLGLNDPRGGMVYEYIRLLGELRPKYFVFENVRSILDYTVVSNQIEKLGYHYVTWTLNAADYGVPQNRYRVFTVGYLSHHYKPHFPSGTSDHDVPCAHVLATCKQIRLTKSECMSWTPNKLRWMKRIPSGGNWRSLPVPAQKKALGLLYEAKGGHSGVFRRLDPAKPSPAITTDPTNLLTMLGHPYYHRPLSVEECAALQSFPKDWKFEGLRKSQYRMIGNAVPPPMAEAVGKSVHRARAEYDRIFR